MILDFRAHSRRVPDFAISSLRDAVGAHLLKSSISISSLIRWLNELKFRRMILDIDAHSRSVPHFAFSFKGARLLKS